MSAYGHIVGRPDSWYEPDPDEYSEADVQLAYDCFVEDEGREPDTDSNEWTEYLQSWIAARDEAVELSRYGL